ncbi:MAG: 4-hydroxy-tetrahydrodipicolinate reductase, partial [Bacteroidota bacterium]
MKIAIIGYGRMGKTIENLAVEAGHEIALIVDEQNREDLFNGALKKADVAIEFTRPDSAFENIKACLETGIPVVSGTTAWLDRLEDVKKICQEQAGAFFYASNFSIGVNVFFALSKYLAELMNEQSAYEVSMEEIHHTGKKDAPSGTAITLAEGILEKLKRKKAWVNDESADAEELAIISKRIDPAPGTHTVEYSSSVDTIIIEHEAHSREGFAKGAIAAAQWIIGKQGVFGMEDLLGF